MLEGLFSRGCRREYVSLALLASRHHQNSLVWGPLPPSLMSSTWHLPDPASPITPLSPILFCASLFHFQTSLWFTLSPSGSSRIFSLTYITPSIPSSVNKVYHIHWLWGMKMWTSLGGHHSTYQQDFNNLNTHQQHVSVALHPC